VASTNTALSASLTAHTYFSAFDGRGLACADPGVGWLQSFLCPFASLTANTDFSAFDWQGLAALIPVWGGFNPSCARSLRSLPKMISPLLTVRLCRD